MKSVFDKIVNWKLLRGSHDFPGPDGGTCINEAAIVAAGFEYKKVMNASDFPLCFSKVIGRFALNLNDNMDDEARNKYLLPFVTRISGTSDRDEIEMARAEFIYKETVLHLVPAVALKVCDSCRSVVGEFMVAIKRAPNFQEMLSLVRVLQVSLTAHKRSLHGADARHAGDFFNRLAHPALYTVNYKDGNSPDAITYCVGGAYEQAGYILGEDPVYEFATILLDKAIRMGRHDELDVGVAAERLEAIRAEAQARKAQPVSKLDQSPSYMMLDESVPF